MNLKFDLDKIKYSSSIKVRIKELLKLLEFYFLNGRPKYLKKCQQELTSFIPEIMNEMTFDELMHIIPNYYQFCYTVTIEGGFLKNQIYIKKKLLLPFSKTVTKKLDSLDLQPLNYNTVDDNYLLICRHAVTKGMYAPGAALYSISSGLLNLGKKIIIVSLGNVDKQFLNLMQKNSNLTIFNNKTTITAEKQLEHLRKICFSFKPSKVITEMPVNIATALYFSNISSKIIYWSPGFTQVPWFDKILLVPELFNEDVFKSKKYIKVPQSLNIQLLNPKVDVSLINKYKKEYNIGPLDFVIGTFARYEKISVSFLKLVSNLLNNNKNRKIIIAGTNDNSIAKKMLKKFIENKQATILGFSDVHILGNCCNIFLDTIPYPCGFSAIEIMAKGKPVVALNQENLDNYKKSRVDELILENESELNHIITKLENNIKFYDAMSEKSIEIAKKYDNTKELAHRISLL
ncbi:glycosyltransferase [Alphaproteobacteria bacterium]|nr:glycosyltransferase [Alphaproteobacteria bacterium]MDB2479068.1 glycosyltransferase [Alphaproteobacteria bacterium]